VGEVRRIEGDRSRKRNERNIFLGKFHPSFFPADIAWPALIR